MTRLFFMTRGVAGCGKSTFIRENGLEPLTISSDKVRLLMSSPVQDATGAMNIDQRQMKQAWELITDLLETRFKTGATTILDATNLKEKDTRPLRNLARDYRYRVYMIDFTDIPEDEIYRRNANRDPLARVPDHVIARMLNVAKSASTPSGVEVITRAQALDLIAAPYKTVIGEEKRSVNIIGDVHGCASALAELMEKIGDADNAIEITACWGAKPPFEEKTIKISLPRKDEKYIFVGDYLDRGLENAHVLSYLMAISSGGYDVVFLEGNHERWIRCWAEGKGEIRNSGFLSHTRLQLEASGLSRKSTRSFCSRLGQYTYFVLGDGREMLVTHGGLSAMPDKFAFVSANEMTHGSGGYEEISLVEKSWAAQQENGAGIVQVHGHRNDGTLSLSPFNVNLEGNVERGGNLRALRVVPGAADELIEIKNRVFEIPMEERDLTGEMEDVLGVLRANKHIAEKPLENNISSFNFTRKAFSEKAWNGQTVRARGLFVDTENNRVKARSYDKFFAIGERDETRLETLARTFEYPVQAYVKENGYLGICSYNDDGTLFCASKSTDQGIYAERFRIILETTLADKACEFSSFLKDQDLSAVFEVIDPEYDKHMVEYSRPVVVSLSLIPNTMEFAELSYDEIAAVADRFGLAVKAHAATINDAAELMEWYSKVKSYDYRMALDNYDGFGSLDVYDDGYAVEGFVLCDASGFMVKVKGDWYAYWKFFRSVVRDVHRRGKSGKLDARAYIREFANTPDPDAVYKFVKEMLNSRDAKTEEPPEIIDVRRAWEASQG